MGLTIHDDRSVRSFLATLESPAETMREAWTRPELELAERQLSDLRERDIAAARREMQLEESEWGSYVSRQEAFQFNENGESVVSDFVNRDDQYQGRMRPLFNDELGLLTIAAIGRYCCLENAPGKGIMERLTDYTIGSGFTYTFSRKAKRKKGQPIPPDERAEALAEKCQAILEGWFESVKWTGDLERELFQESRRDGEAMVRLQPRAGRLPDIRSIAYEWVTQPESTSWMPDEYGGLDWTFGVGTDVNRTENARAYFVQWGGQVTDYDLLPACEVVHLKMNVGRRQKRGISDFFPARYLRMADKIYGNALAGGAIQASIAGIRKHAAGVTESQMETMRLGLKTSQGKESTSTGPRDVYGKRIKAGRELDISAGMDYMYGPMGQLGGPVFMEIGQAGVRQAATMWGMPEFMSTGDASNSAYASTMVAGSPFVRYIEHSQSRFKVFVSEIVWNVLSAACLAGWLLEFGIANLRELKQAIQLDITAPAAAVGEDSLATAQTDQIYVGMGAKSVRTVAEEQDLDYDNELENGAAAVVSAPQSMGANLDLHQPEKVASPVATSGAPVADDGLNGAQITAVLDVFAQLASGTVAGEVAVGLLVSVGIPEAKARRMVTLQQQAGVKQAADKAKELEAAKAQAAFGGKPNFPPKEVKESAPWWQTKEML